MLSSEIARQVLDDEQDRSIVSKLDNVALRQRVYESLAGALRAGRFAPAEVVTIRGLAQMLGTSPMPVREAVNRLMTEGALEAMPNRTMRVPQISIAGFMELTSVRMTIEGQAAALAAENMTPVTFSMIKAANDRYEVATRNKDISTVLSTNGEFHFLIYEATKSPLLLSIIEMLWLRGGPYIAAEARGMSNHEDALLSKRGAEHHHEMLTALADRDPNAMRKALCADINDASVWFRKNILERVSTSEEGHKEVASILRALGSSD